MSTPTEAAPAQPATADWLDPAVMAANPYETYERLRALGPVVWAPVMKRYLAVSFAACQAIEADQQTYSASVSGSGATMVRALGAQPMLRKDDPDHAAERKAVNPCLRPRAIRDAWVPRFESNARRYLDEMRAIGSRVADLNRDFAAPLAAANLIDILGLRGATATDMQRWSHAFIAGIGNLHDDADIWARCDQAQSEVDGLLDDLIPRLRAEPDSSMISALANSDQHDDSVRANVKLTISGGMNEPQHVVTTMVWALSAHPDQRETVLAEPGLWSRVFEEAVRWSSPIGMYPRETTRETVLDGVMLPARAALGVVVGAANRDREAFDDPDRFDMNREKRPHLGFGSGVHLCAGIWAARISVGEIAVPLLYRSLPGLRTDPVRDVEWQGWVFRGLTALPVTWNA